MSSNADKFLAAADPFPEDALPEHRVYEHPLVQRYATKEMSFIWSPAMKFTTWRKLWTALATAEQELGLDISDEQLEEMRTKLFDVDFGGRDLKDIKDGCFTLKKTGESEERDYVF